MYRLRQNTHTSQYFQVLGLLLDLHTRYYFRIEGSLTDAAMAFGQVEVLSEDGETAFLTDRISGQDAAQQSKFLNVLACMRVLA